MILRFMLFIGIFFFIMPSSNAQPFDDSYDSLYNAEFAKRYEIAMYKYSKCLVNLIKREKFTKEYLLIPDNHPDQNIEGNKLIIKTCLPNGSRLVFKGHLFRRSLYTALYNKSFRKIAPTNIDIAIEFDYSEEIAPYYKEMGDAQLLLRKATDCAVRKDLNLAHNFVTAKLHSKKENKLKSDIAKPLQECLPKKVRLQLTRQALKGQFAESLYKLRTISTQNSLEAAE